MGRQLPIPAPAPAGLGWAGTTRPDRGQQRLQVSQRPAPTNRASAVPPALAVLVTNLLPGDAYADGAWVACLVAIAEQQIFGAVALRDSGFSIADRVRRSLLNLAISLVIIILKVLVPTH